MSRKIHYDGSLNYTACGRKIVGGTLITMRVEVITCARCKSIATGNPIQ